MSWSATLPWVPPSGNAVKRWLYGGRGGEHRYARIRESAGWAVKVLLAHVPPATGPRLVRITRSVPRRGKLYDDDNLRAGCKPLVDELVALQLLVDDTPALVTVEYSQERTDALVGETLVEIEDLSPQETP